MKGPDSQAKRYYTATGRYRDSIDRDAPREDGKRGKGRWGKERKDEHNNSLTGF